MDIGKRIYELRKMKNLSQEQLGEKVGVSRQTISKWELGETSPDIKQAQQLSQIFNVSLDELTGNDTREVIIEKVSNTEKLAGVVIKILRVVGILILASIVVTIVSVIAFTGLRRSNDLEHEVDREETTMSITENVGENKYYIEIGSDGTFESSGLTSAMKEELLDLINFDDLEVTEENIRRYFAELRDRTE